MDGGGGEATKGGWRGDGEGMKADEGEERRVKRRKHRKRQSRRLHACSGSPGARRRGASHLLARSAGDASRARVRESRMSGVQ